jgi:type IV conjugative transfer system lipoprotein TraV
MKQANVINTIKMAALLAVILINSGCTSMLNPFDASDFNCPSTDTGKCISVTDAYNEATNNSSGSGYRSPFITEVQPEQEPKKGSKKGSTKASKKAPKNDEVDNTVSITGIAAFPPLSASEKGYQDATYDKLAGLLKKPVSPIVAPADVVRVLMLPYKSGGDELFMYRYSYFIASTTKFVIGDYLVEEER